eukprot:g21699.t3
MDRCGGPFLSHNTCGGPFLPSGFLDLRLKVLQESNEASEDALAAAQVAVITEAVAFVGGGAQKAASTTSGTGLEGDPEEDILQGPELQTFL